MDHPLEGMSCVELGERGAAGYAGKLLRRLGANVVKVEAPEGDPLRTRYSRRHRRDGATTTPAFDYFNEGKVTTVVAEPAELRRLIGEADAFILDLEPRRYAAWGLDTENLDQLQCKAVCAITPFGLSGPYRDFLSSELIASAFGGMSVGIGEPGRPPLRMPLMQTAIQSGLVAASAAIGVLLDPGTEGKPTVVDISETDVWATVHAGTTVVAFLFSNRMRRREGHRLLGQPYPHQLFRCKDGWIAIQGSERKQYEQFVEMVGSPQWASDRRFGTRMEMNFKHADEIDALLAPWFMERTSAEIFAECRKRKIPAAPVRSMSQVREDRDFQVRGELETFLGATGVELTVPAPPFRFRTATLKPAGPAPKLPV